MGMSAGASTKEINVTPLIDVLLVLLIIFLVMVPIMTRLTPVDLPSHERSHHEPPIVIKLHADLTISIDDGPAVPAHELASIRREVGRRAIFVDAAATLPWTEVVAVVDRIKGLDPSPDSVRVAVRIHDNPEP